MSIESIDKIEAKLVMLSPSRVSLEKTEYETLATAAKKYYAQEKRESKLQKALDAAYKLIDELKLQIKSLKAQVASMNEELFKYKSVRSKQNTVSLEQENEELRSKVRRYEGIIDRQNLRHLFGRGCVKMHARNDSR